VRTTRRKDGLSGSASPDGLHRGLISAEHDFVGKRLSDGHWIRVLTVGDQYTRVFDA